MKMLVLLSALRCSAPDELPLVVAGAEPLDERVAVAAMLAADASADEFVVLPTMGVQVLEMLDGMV